MADGHQVFDATIKAVDEASGPIGKVMASAGLLGRMAQAIGAHAKGMGHAMEAAFGEAEHGGHKAEHAAHGAGEAIKKAGHSAEHAGHQIEHAAHPRVWLALAAHAHLFRGHLGAISASVGEIGHGVTEFLPALAGLGAGAGLVGLFEMVEKVSDSFSEMNKAAISAGLTGKEFAQLSFAAKMTDVSVESMGASMFKLNRVIGDSAAGKNKNALALFEHLGIELRDANGHMVSAAQVMPELAEAFSKTSDPAMRARMAVALFGKAGAEMLPILMAGKEELQEFAKQSDELRYPFTEDDKKNLEGYHRSMLALGVAVSGFANEIGAKLAPVLRPIIDMATEWVAKNRDWIATGITVKVQQLAEWLGKIPFREVLEAASDWVREMVTMGQHLGGIGTVIGAVTLALGSPLLSGVAAAIGIFATFGRALVQLSALMWANPILAVVGVLGIAAYELYQHWDAVKAFFIDLWAGVKASFADAWAYIQPIVQRIQDAAGFVQNGWLGRQLGIDGGGAGAMPAPSGGGPLPSLYGPSGSVSAPAGGGGTGLVRTEITINGLPPGSTVRSAAAGIAQRPDVDVGYSQAGLAAAY
jgi:hypothetical protein